MTKKKKKTLLVCLAILLTTGAITAFIFLTEPTASQSGATKETAMLVDIAEVQRGTFQPTIVATGNVQPAEDIMLSPRVGGEIIRRADGFTPGGFVKKGEILLQIDPADYRNTLQLQESALQQAKADLAIEQGRQDVAQQDYELVDELVAMEDKNLVLREPQLNAVKAQVKAAQASVNQAELNLRRTTIRAPFDAHVLTRNANLGSQVAPGDNLGRLVGMDEYWVVVTLPLSKLPYISLPGEGRMGSAVRIVDRKAWPEGAYRTGYVQQLVGALEDQTRLARLLVSVPDPLAYQNDTLPALMINSFVETSIQANELSGIVRLSRDYIRENETVWVMEEGRLSIREVNVTFMDAEHAYISNGLQDSDQIVTTNLSTVADGARLRTEADTTATQDSTSASARISETETQSSEDINE
ncbi:MAG: efflux RND transporter periplasmic adaptor subunit [Cyclobacteriaceae bacterium]